MTRDDAVYFLLVYSFDQGKLVHQDEFTDRTQGIRAYDSCEREYRNTLDKFEIVLIGADSIETVMQTHGHYFSTSSDDSIFSDFLADA